MILKGELIYWELSCETLGDSFLCPFGTLWLLAGPFGTLWLLAVGFWLAWNKLICWEQSFGTSGDLLPVGIWPLASV